MHQFIERETGRVRRERLYQDKTVCFLYGELRERMPQVFRLLVSRRSTALLGYLNYDTRIGSFACRRFLRANDIALEECLDRPRDFDTLRKLFERKIRYWECRPLADADVVSPADARVLLGSFSAGSPVFVKGKFFEFEELLARDKARWLATFRDGDFAIFRLTPEKYHYNHTPVAGRVADIYEINGDYHSCNPGAVVRMVTPYSKNRRVVTIIDTDVPGGAGVGHVAMIEIVALMIGDIVQCYSERRYDHPQALAPGMRVAKGQPKSLYRPGSSTTVLVFERDRVRFAQDLLHNQAQVGVISRFSRLFGGSLVETDVKVRSRIAETCTD